MPKKIKKIGITGGKGGTGKSAFAVLLSLKLIEEGKKVILCDCDVECPNDYLISGKKLNRPAKNIFAEFPVLDKKKCAKCGTCVKACRQHAIFQPRDKKGNPGYPIFIKDLCENCGACWTVCPFGAIKTKKERTGKIYAGKIKENLWLVTGLANPGLEETGPIVAKTKKFALDFAKRKKADYILFDTAAGTHCPVVSALLGCDFAYCVTEPTPMGAYDLGLILDLCEKLKIPAKIVLNRADLGRKETIGKIAEKFKLEIEKEIPHSKKIAEAYSKGRLAKMGKIQVSEIMKNL